jgi:response regulator of citrate/malate metabolism
MSDRLVLMRESEFDRLVEDISDRIMKKMDGFKAVKESEQHMTGKEIAAHLKITEKTLRARFKSGQYPARLKHNHAGRPAYFKSEFEQFTKSK